MSARTALSSRSFAKRGDILEAASDLFAERGFERTTMKDLADHARVSTATVYAHFSDKQALLDDVLDDRLLALVEQMVDRVRSIEDPLEQLLEGIRVLNETLARERLLARILIRRSGFSDRQLRRSASRIEKRLDGLAIAQIRNAVEAGRIACDDPEALAVLIRAAFQGWWFVESQRGQHVSNERVTGALLALIRAREIPRARRR
jgi:AcrR family transcriptional regulator